MQSIKTGIKKIPVIGNLALSVYRLFRPENLYSSAYWIDRYIPNDKLSVVQIGSNDGVSGDPLHQHVKKNDLWNVLFVEPVPYIFEKLRENYGSESRFRFENAAINEDGNNQFFYTVSTKAFEDIPGLSSDYHQIGSFNKEQVLKLSQGRVDHYVTGIEVNCLTLDRLFSKNGIDSLDLFHIDAEGYDWKVLSQLDLETYQPVVIAFEYSNLSDSERTEALRFLSDAYYVFAFRIDYCCIRKDKIKARDLRVLQSRLLGG